MMNILFVCMGNTCRSPMAEGLFRNFLKEKNIEGAECLSAGLGAFPGDEVSENAVIAAKEKGADISSHRSRPLSMLLAEQTDIFVCMNESLALAVKSALPNANTLVLSGGVPDPYGGDIEVYRECAEKIISGFDEIVKVIKAEIKIVPMEEKHVGDILKIERACFSSPWTEEGIKAELTDKTAHFIAAEKDGVSVGYCGMHEVCGECYIANIAVLPEYRRKGIAAKLLENLISHCEESSAEFLSLEVRKSNAPAISLYEKFGFEKMGERKDFYSNPKENALIMTRNFK